jgi:hypothetical protein
MTSSGLSGLGSRWHYTTNRKVWWHDMTWHDMIIIVIIIVMKNVFNLWFGEMSLSLSYRSLYGENALTVLADGIILQHPVAHRLLSVTDALSYTQHYLRSLNFSKQTLHYMLRPIWPCSCAKTLAEGKLLCSFCLISCGRVPCMCWYIAR